MTNVWQCYGKDMADDEAKGYGCRLMLGVAVAASMMETLHIRRREGEDVVDRAMAQVEVPDDHADPRVNGICCGGLDDILQGTLLEPLRFRPNVIDIRANCAAVTGVVDHNRPTARRRSTGLGGEISSHTPQLPHQLAAIPRAADFGVGSRGCHPAAT